MAQTQKYSVSFLLIVLVVLAFAIGFIYSWDSSDSEVKSIVKSSPSQEYVEILGEKEISSTSVIVTDRFVQKFDPNGNIVVLGSDGSAYSVTNGAVLVSGVLIDVEQGSSYSVKRVNNERKSIYNNNAI